MRIILTTFLVSFCFLAIGQKIEYRHDSLFVNSYFVDAQTNKSVLDSILDFKGKTKTSKDEFTKNPTTGKKVVLTTYFYHELGLFFRKYNHDTSKLSLGIKLYRDTDVQEDEQSELNNTFKDQLYIAENLINDKRQIAQLKNLKSCTVTVSEVRLGSYSSIIGGDLIYGRNVIRLSFDKKTKDLTEVFIHYNFVER